MTEDSHARADASREETTGEMSDGLRVGPVHPASDRKPGDTNIQRFGFDVHPVVFPVSVIVIAAFIVVTLVLGDTASAAYAAVFYLTNATFGWWYVLAINAFLLTVLYFAFGKYGSIRIGGAEADKEFSDFSWMAMLLGAGVCTGLMFFSVAEPIWHFASGGGTYFAREASTYAAGEAAMAVTFFHWGFHLWAVYGLVALCLSFFSFNRGLPLTFRSVLWPLLGERIYGWPGHVIDLVTVFATLFSLATTLGLGVAQVNAGIAEVSSILLGTAVVRPDSTVVRVLLVAGITGIATLSVAAGLDGGVKRLSTLNLYLMVVFLAFMLIAGPTLFVLNTLVGGIGTYLQNALGLALYTEAFAPPAGQAGSWPHAGWQHAWTLFYWGWWISWSPFVGTFIARISKGRTVRELVVGVLVVPSLFSFLWLATFGASALNVELAGAGGSTAALAEAGQASAMFAMLESYPLTALTSVLATLLVISFFVTSSDSGSLVVDHLTSGGKHDVPKVQRIFWAVTEGAVAAILLYGGGLNALQTAAMATGLPFSIILLVMCYTVYLGLDHEHEIVQSRDIQERAGEIADDVVTEPTDEYATDVRQRGSSFDD